MTNVIPIRRDIRTDDEGPGECEALWIADKTLRREIKRAEHELEARLARQERRRA